jgi:hypothetical protein
MKRSAGVTVIAVFTLIGSGLMLLMGILTLVLMMLAPLPSSTQAQAPPAFMRAIFFFLFLMYLLPAVWGIATGVGLFRLKNWARISTIVFSVLLIGASCFAGLITAMMPLPSTPTSNLDPAVTSAVRIVMGAFWLFLSGIGIWWLIFFTRAAVSGQFVAARSPATAGLSGPPPALSGAIQEVSAIPEQPGPKRPVSITIIAWLLLAGCILMPLNILVHAPAVVFTKLLTGWAASLCYLGYAVIHFFTGRGLLRLKPWARQAGIALYGFGFINMIAFYFTPGAHARMLALMESQNSMFPWFKVLPNQPQFHFDPTPFSTIFGILGTVVIAVPIYFLITRRAAFE